MLEYKKSLETDEEAKMKHDKENAKPLPPVKAWKVAKPHGRDKAVITDFHQPNLTPAYDGNPNLYDKKIDI